MTPWRCGDFYKERSTYILCHHTHNFLPNYNSLHKRNARKGKGRWNIDWNEIRGGDMEGRGSSWLGRPGKIHFFHMERKESCVRRGKGGDGEGGWCLTFFNGVINSLSALVTNEFCELWRVGNYKLLYLKNSTGTPLFFCMIVISIVQSFK